MPRSRARAIWSALSVGLLWTHFLIPNVAAEIVEPLEQGFLFDWSGDAGSPIPTAAQCDTLHIQWGRRSATGPNPVAPYYLQIFTSTFIVPFVIPAGSDQSFDWPVPFIPGTQFQICMYASNGVTGGCQQIYTVYQRPNTTLNNPPTCQNLTYPSGALDVKATGSDGSWSAYGWYDQCTDINIKPVNGTPPYTYTVAPALRPPYNFTSATSDAVNWTITLAFGLPFFLTVADSTGFSWTNGPIHAGPNGPTSCSSSQITEDSGLSTSNVVGVGVGSLAAGLLAGLAGAFFFFRRRERRYAPVGGLALLRKSTEQSPLSSAVGYSQPPSSSASGSFAHAFPHRLSGAHIEPFILPSEEGLVAGASAANTPHSATFSTLARPLTGDSRDAPPSPLYHHAHSPSSGSLGGAGPSSTGASIASPSSTGPPQPARSPGLGSGGGNGGGGGGAQQHVYVVHHDGGRPPPVTVFTSDGTEVVELPPHYEPPADARDARERGLLVVQPPPPGGQQARHPRGLVQKAPRVPSNGS